PVADVVAGEAAPEPRFGVPLPPDAVVALAQRVEVFLPDGFPVVVPLPPVAQFPFPGPVVLLRERPRPGVAPQVEPGVVDELPGDQKPPVLRPLPAGPVQAAVAVGLLLQQPPVGVEAVLGAVPDPAPHRGLELQPAFVVPLAGADLLPAHEVRGGPF